MIFTATEQQVKEIALNAIKASEVVGMGYYQATHFQGVPLTVDDIDLRDDGLYIDYFRGRMVKLDITKKGEDTWEIRDKVDIEYQSWGKVYPKVEILVQSVTDNEEFLEAYIAVMYKLVDQTIGMEMAELSIYPSDKWATTARRICDKNPEIHKLVNKEIEERRNTKKVYSQYKKKEDIS